MTKAEADEMFYGPKPKIGPESRAEYEERQRGWPSPEKMKARIENRPGEWYGCLAGEPLEALIVRLVGRSPSRVVQTKVWEDKANNGYWVSWLWEGEARRKEMFVSHLEIAR
jgi:hypothetical protein